MVKLSDSMNQNSSDKKCMLFSQDSTTCYFIAIEQLYIVQLVDWEKPRQSSERNK